MKTDVLGGLEIRHLDENNSKGLYLLGQRPYEYKMLRASEPTKVQLTGQDTYCIFNYASSSRSAPARINGQTLAPNETMYVSHTCDLRIETADGETTLLIGSTQRGHGLENKIKIFAEKDVKRVTKPWGYELWLTGDPSPYFAFKKIFIRAGTKTSLQYHVQKRETNFLVEGEASLHFNPDSRVAARDFSPGQVAQKRLVPLSVVDVFPNSIHRLEALTDILLFEVSTPELDDVVRISDDAGRENGRISSEH